MQIAFIIGAFLKIIQWKSLQKQTPVNAGVLLLRKS
jgi:hypothetical protein